MSDDTANDDEVTWKAWCEHDGCDWTNEATAGTTELAQRLSSSAMVGHGLAEGHHETKHERMGDSDA